MILLNLQVNNFELKNYELNNKNAKYANAGDFFHNLRKIQMVGCSQL